MTNNTFTIITPSFNQDQFIEKTINSVLSQEGGFYIDYIVADGGSTDNSVEIIKKYDKLLKNKKYPVKCKGINYRWWSEKDNGQSHAINKGLTLASGDVLAWINSDDFYEQGAFRYINNMFKSYKQIDLFYGDCYQVTDKKLEKKLIKLKQIDYKKIIKWGCLIYQPAAFFTKRIINKIGLLNEELKYCMDYDLWLRILKENNCLYCPRVLANYRLWPDSKTVSQIKKLHQESEKVRRKYGGRIFEQPNISRIRSLIPFSALVKNKYPKIYKFLKIKLYKIINLLINR